MFTNDFKFGWKLRLWIGDAVAGLSERFDEAVEGGGVLVKRFLRVHKFAGICLELAGEHEIFVVQHRQGVVRDSRRLHGVGQGRRQGCGAQFGGDVFVAHV